MATTTISGMTLGTAANLTGAAVFETEDSTGASVYFSMATLRTKLFEGGTGYTATDPLTVGLVTASGATPILTTNCTTTGVFGHVRFQRSGVTKGYVGTDASDNLSLISSGAVAQLTVDASSTANDTRLLLWDVTAGALVRVSRGASDSGGTGFRSLRVPN